jgi:hypothetical protein
MGIGGNENSMAFEFPVSDGSFPIRQTARKVQSLLLKTPFVGFMRLPLSNLSPTHSLTCSTSPDHEPGVLVKIPALCHEHSPPLT